MRGPAFQRGTLSKLNPKRYLDRMLLMIRFYAWTSAKSIQKIILEFISNDKGYPGIN